MTEIIIPSLYFLTGICAYAGFIHFSAGLRRPFNLAQIAFALMCLALSLYVLFHGQVLKAEDLDDFIVALKWSLNFVILFFALFLWFIALISKKYAPTLQSAI